MRRECERETVIKLKKKGKRKTDKIFKKRKRERERWGRQRAKRTKTGGKRRRINKDRVFRVSGRYGAKQRGRRVKEKHRGSQGKRNRPRAK